MLWPPKPKVLHIALFMFFSFPLFAADCKKPSMPSADEWKQWLENIKLEVKITKDIQKLVH